MSLVKLSESEKRTVTRGAIAAGILLFIMFGVKPTYLRYQDTTAQLEFERDALVREQAAIAAAQQNPQLQHVADSLMQTSAPRLFSGRDDVMASAELVSYLDEVAGNNHVLLSEDATRPAAKVKSGVRTLNVDIRGESDLRGVLQFLQAIERGNKLLRVTRLDISKPSRDADDIETVLFAATVSGYALAVEAPVNVKARPTAGSAASPASLGDSATKPGPGATP